MSSTGVDDEEIIAVLREGESVEHSTTAVAEELPIGRGQTRSRLQRLVDDGRVRRRRDGNNVVWWLPDREDELDAGGEAAAVADGNGTDEEDGDTADAGDGDEEATERDGDGTEEAVEEAAEEVEAAAEDIEETVEEAAEDVSEEVAGATGETADDVEAAAADVEETVEEAVEDVAEATAAVGEAVDEVTDVPERPGGRDDRMRQVALALGAVILVVVLRRLLGGSEDEDRDED